jgi:uncharacterized RDD family membrane protein YckC
VSAAESTLPVVATRYPGVGPRAAATVIDGIIGSIVIGLPLVLLFGEKSTTTNATGGTSTMYSTSDPKVLLLWFVLVVAYYTVFEAALGVTPGKFVLGLRVRDRTGEKPTPKASLIRNALRIVDAFPYVIPYLVGAIAIWNDDSWSGDGTVSRRRRIGDRVAGTIVTYR